MTYSLKTQLLEVERELAMRRKVYPRMVLKGEIRQSVADMQIAIMQAVADTLTDALRAGNTKHAISAQIPPTAAA